MKIIANSDIINNTIIVKQSKFICRIIKVETEQAAITFLKEMMQHNCYVYIIMYIL